MINLAEFNCKKMKTKEDIVKNWLPRYTGKKLEEFGKYILLTNFSNYVNMFAEWNNVEVVGKDKVDNNRFEQELIYYIDKLDITEEKVRLKSHCDYFLEILKNKDANGKKLGFISQEIGREINTMGSKANDANIQRYVVGMKEELEKIKEQLLNVL